MVKNKIILNEILSLKNFILTRRGFKWDIKSLLDKDGITFSNLEFKKLERFRVNITKFDNYYIVINNCDNLSKIINQFIYDIKPNELNTISKIVKLYYLISIIDIRSDQQIDIIRTFLKKLTLNKTESLILKFIDEINNIDWFPEQNFKEPKNWDELQILYRKFQTANIYDENPIKIFIELLYYSNYENIILIFKQLKMIPLLLLLIHSRYQDKLFRNITELKNSIKDKKIDPQIISFIITKLNANEINVIPKKFLSWLCLNYWNEAGKYICRHCFGNVSQYNHIRYELFEEVINDIFEEWIIEKKNYSFIESMEWPNDFESFSGWCNFKKYFELDDVFLNRLSSRLLNICKNYIKLSNVFFENNAYKNLFFNIFNPKSNLTLSLTSYCILNSERTISIEWNNYIKSILYYLKPLFYSNYEIISKALKYLDAIFVVFLSICNFKKQDITKEVEDNIIFYIDTIIDTVLFSYIKNQEFNHLVWEAKYNNEGPGKGDNEYLWLIINSLTRIKKDEYYNKLFNKLLTKWKDFSTTNWPWMK